MERLNQAPITATSILNGAFADMLTGTAPLILFNRNRVLYWHDADQEMDFTTMDDAAAFTAEAALDADAPRFLQVAGDHVSARDLAGIMTELTGTRFRLTYCGGIGFLRRMARIGKALAPKPGPVYPAWQGMQYFDNIVGVATTARTQGSSNGAPSPLGVQLEWFDGRVGVRRVPGPRAGLAHPYRIGRLGVRGRVLWTSPRRGCRPGSGPGDGC